MSNSTNPHKNGKMIENSIFCPLRDDEISVNPSFSFQNHHFTLENRQLLMENHQFILEIPGKSPFSPRKSPLFSPTTGSPWLPVAPRGRRHVHVEDVAILQGSVVGDAMPQRLAVVVGKDGGKP